jgi:hypothetical protein
MTAAARKVLDDCRVALEMLKEEERPDRWRIIWVSTLALVRGVANVLSTVDCRTPFQKSVFEVMLRDWYTKPEHDIFQKFIMSGRSMVLQDYGVSQGLSDQTPLDLARIEHDRSIEIDYSQFDLSRHLVPSEYRPGADAKEILADAIAWWDLQLNIFDEAAGESHGLLPETEEMTEEK